MWVRGVEWIKHVTFGISFYQFASMSWPFRNSRMTLFFVVLVKTSPDVTYLGITFTWARLTVEFSTAPQPMCPKRVGDIWGVTWYLYEQEFLFSTTDVEFVRVLQLIMLILFVSLHNYPNMKYISCGVSRGHLRLWFHLIDEKISCFIIHFWLIKTIWRLTIGSNWSLVSDWSKTAWKNLLLLAISQILYQQYRWKWWICCLKCTYNRMWVPVAGQASDVVYFPIKSIWDKKQGIAHWDRDIASTIL